MNNTNDYVIARINFAGVFFCKLGKEENGNLTLLNVRKIYYWEGANTVEDIAVKGVKYPEKTKMTIEVEEMEVLAANKIQIIPCTQESINILKAIKIWTIQ